MCLKCLVKSKTTFLSLVCWATVSFSPQLPLFLVFSRKNSSDVIYLVLFHSELCTGKQTTRALMTTAFTLVQCHLIIHWDKLKQSVQLSREKLDILNGKRELICCWRNLVFSKKAKVTWRERRLYNRFKGRTSSKKRKKLCLVIISY